MKKVLIFSTAYDPFVGGAEVALEQITNRIKNVEFVLITAKLKSDLKEEEQIGNIKVYRVGKGNKWDKFRLFFSGVKKAVSLGKFDVVWSIMASYAGFAGLRYKKRDKKVPFLLTLQEGDSKWHIYKHVWWCWPYFKQIFRKADRIQAISNYLASWAKDMGAKCEVEVIPNGVNIENLERQNKSNDLKRVVSVSRLVKKNGLEDLIRGVAELNKNYHQPVILKIIGDGELRSGLEGLAKELGLEDRFRIFEGAVPYKEVYDRLTQADVFVRSSLTEGLGNAFLEAMAVGVPVIGTKVGGIPDFLKDGETGLFCKVKDPKDIADKIKKILDNKELADKLSRNGQKLVKENYSWNSVSDRMEKLINKMI